MDLVKEAETLANEAVTEAKKFFGRIKELFETHPSVDEFHATSDGQFFFEKHMADNHGSNLRDKGVATITRNQVNELIGKEEALSPVADAQPNATGDDKGTEEKTATDLIDAQAPLADQSNQKVKKAADKAANQNVTDKLATAVAPAAETPAADTAADDQAKEQAKADADNAANQNLTDTLNTVVADSAAAQTPAADPSAAGNAATGTTEGNNTEKGAN